MTPRQPWWEEQNERWRTLVRSAQQRGYVSHAELIEALPAGVTDPDILEDVLSLLNDLGVAVVEDEGE